MSRLGLLRLVAHRGLSSTATARRAPRPLDGVKVLELEGLAAAPFAGLVLADFGADVVRVDRRYTSPADGPHPVGTLTLAGGKQSVQLDVKCDEDRAALLDLVARADVLIEPYRPGVMERLSLGPNELLAHNPRLVYARLTGWGQTGDLALMVGHDINYIALTGLLHGFARPEQPVPTPPANLLGDFCGGAMSCVVGILMALFERERSGQGQVVDAAMVDGAMYAASMLFVLRQMKLWNPTRPGTNMLDTGAPFYDVYPCADNTGHVAVGAIEPAFYHALLEGLDLNVDEFAPKQLDVETWPATRQLFRERFASETREFWTARFDGTDACVTPVLNMDEAVSHPQVQARQRRQADDGGSVSMHRPAPAPKLSRTPAVPHNPAAAAATLDLATVLARWDGP